jgi:hypothetical protein
MTPVSGATRAMSQTSWCAKTHTTFVTEQREWSAYAYREAAPVNANEWQILQMRVRSEG